MPVVNIEDLGEDIPIEAEEAEAWSASAVDLDEPSLVRSGLRVPRRDPGVGAAVQLPRAVPRSLRADVLAAALRRLDDAPHPGAMLANVGTVVRSLAPRPMGDVDPERAAVLRTLDAIDDLMDADIPFPDPALWPGFLGWRAQLLARVDECPVRALEEAMDDALVLAREGRDGLWDARADFFVRTGQWREALRSYRSARIHGSEDTVRSWRQAAAAVAVADEAAASAAFRSLGVPVTMAASGRPRSPHPTTIPVVASTRLAIPGIGAPPCHGGGDVEVLVEALSPVHGWLVEPVEGELPLRVGDVLVWDRSPGGADGFRVIARVAGEP